MLTFILVAGLFFVLAIIWVAYRLIKSSASEPIDKSKISNVGDINHNNKLGKFGVDGL